MSKIISIHSYRGGTGKSNITANIAWTLMMKGKCKGRSLFVVPACTHFKQLFAFSVFAPVPYSF
jgi:Mrp family chromosome partitioning ATPase